MSSKRDLVEAHSFNKRRLITAFLSGAPGGREVEPVRYGRPLVGGIIVTALVLVGAAVSGFLKPTVPDDWLDHGLVVGKQSGSRFVSSKGTLYPVINTTSARLLLGSLKVDFVPDDKIAQQPQGPAIGITGAPDVLPSAGHLQPSGWTACTNGQQGINVSLAAHSGVTAAGDAAFLAQTSDGEYVVSGKDRYELPNDSYRAATLRALGMDGVPARTVPGQWLDLLDLGSPLKPFTVPDEGKPANTGVSGLDTVGTPVKVDGRPYVLGAGKRLYAMTDFAYALYLSSGQGANLRPVSLSAGDVSGLQTVNDPGAQPFPDDWPTAAVTPYTSTDNPCVRLSAEAGRAPYAELGTPTGKTALADGGSVTRHVDVGSGAVVRSSVGGVINSGDVYLVGAGGERYAIGTDGTSSSVLSSLGYGNVTPVPVPASWLQLFSDGPELSAAAVRTES